MTNMQGPEVSREPTFKQELALLINKHGIDAKLEIPDFIIANFLGMSISGLERMKLEGESLIKGLNERRDS